MDKFRETRLVLLCADLAGFMRATASLTPLEVAALLDAYYERADAAVSRHGGRHAGC